MPPKVNWLKVQLFGAIEQLQLMVNLFNNREVLQGVGQISKVDAENKAKAVYDKFTLYRMAESHKYKRMIADL